MKINNDIKCHVFIQWLAEMGILIAWLDHTIDFLGPNLYANRYIDAHDIMDGLFQWDKTTEGFNYWEDFNNKWYTTLEAINE